MDAPDLETAAEPVYDTVFDLMISTWPDRETALIHAKRAGRSDVLVILREEPVPRPQPSFTPAASIRATNSFPVAQ